METLYTIEEVAQLVKVNQGSVRRWIRDGKLKTVKIVGNVRITESELNRLMGK
jgi:excisionase family DNA binding protein